MSAPAGKAIELLKNASFDVVLTDLRLPIWTGRDTQGGQVAEPALSRDHSHSLWLHSFRGRGNETGGFHYLEKPFEKDQLLLVLQNAVDQVRLLKDNIMLKDQLVDKFQLDNIISDHGTCVSCSRSSGELRHELHCPDLRRKRNRERAFCQEHPLQ